MRKTTIFIIIGLVITLLISCNADSSKGVLQRVYSATADESAYNQQYLGMDTKSGIYLVRDNDIYRVKSVLNVDKTYDLEYQKLIETSTTGNNFVPIGYYDGYLFFATKTDSIFTFFYVLIADLGSEVVTMSSAYSNYYSTVSFGDSLSVEAISVSRMNIGELQFIYSVSNDENTYYAYTTPDKLSTNGITFAAEPIAIPENAEICGSKSIRVRTEDPEIDDYDDDLNELYFLDNGTLDKVYVNISDPDYFACGTDTYGNARYAAFMNGYIYPLVESSKDGYAYQRSSYVTSFYDYERNNNFLILFDDGSDVVGYIYDSGVYLRESNGEPTVKTISDDSNVFPLCFLGYRTNDSGHKEYLMLTQNNGLFVVEPYYHLRPTRSFITKVNNTSSEYNLSDYLQGDV